MNRVQRALWRRRLTYRQRRHAYWHKRHNALKAAKWHHLVGQARDKLAPPVPAKGIDISNLQGPIDFAKVKAAGYRFVYVKAGEGDWPDPTFLHNVTTAQAAGLKVGAYQFLRPRPGRTGAQEAAYFIARLRQAKLGAGDLRPVLDVEATGLSPAETRRYVLDFVMALKATGRHPIIYTGKWFWDPQVQSKDDFGCPLWIAAYQSAPPRLPTPWTSWVIWQHSSNGQVPGIKGDVDLNKTPDLRKVIA